MLHVQRHQRVDDDEERRGVEGEGRVHRLRLAVAALDEAGERGREEQRPEHAREVELDGVERDGVRQIFLVHEHRQQRLVGRPAERLREARDERQREDVPDLDDVQIHQHGERGRGRHLDVLRREQRLAPVVAIGEHAADEREEDDRELLQERVEAQVKRRSGQRQHEPVLRDDLHPGADRRAARPNPLDPEIPIGEGRQRAAHGALQGRQGAGG